jgi:phenylalanyl-tRNA synthetase beta chain
MHFEQWLRKLVNPPLASGELAHLLTMAGLEVEEMRAVAPPFSGVVVAQVLSVDQHPNADRLSVCKVDAAPDVPTSLRRPNVAPGIMFPCALVGAAPAAEAGQGPFEIRRATMRGVDSAGMLCGARLQLGRSLKLLVLPADAPVGETSGGCWRWTTACSRLLTPTRRTACRYWAWPARSLR